MPKTSGPPLAAVRDILVGTMVDGAREPASSAVGYGLTLAKATGAHLTVQSSAWRLSGDDAWFGAFDKGESIFDRRLGDFARDIAGRAAGEAALAGIVCTTESPSLPYPDIVSRLATLARLYDLTVLDAGSQTFDLDREVIETVLFASGRPVITVPAACSAFSARRIVVAWDGSAQAARAANDALPFLRAAEAVEIVTVGDVADVHEDVPGAEFAPHLARHGVNVTVNVLPRAEGIADNLRAQAGLFRADMIVMGAYRHSRAREFFVGGVTRSLLERSPVPLLLAH